MALSDTAIKNAKPKAKPYKKADEKGLYLLVTPTENKGGGKWWRLKYRFGGKEKLLSLGTYPEVSLQDARQKRDDARKLTLDRGDVIEGWSENVELSKRIEFAGGSNFRVGERARNEVW